MDFEEFERIIKKLDKNKYHISRTLVIKDGKFDVETWEIFRKDMSEEEYYDPKNLAILSSKNENTIEDIKKLIEEK